MNSPRFIAFTILFVSLGEFAFKAGASGFVEISNGNLDGRVAIALTTRGGKLWLQDHGSDVWFRNIRLRSIPPEKRLARSEFVPMPIPPAAWEKENERMRQILKPQEKE